MLNSLLKPVFPISGRMVSWAKGRLATNDATKTSAKNLTMME
jgi:hypothetical protein